MATLLEPAEKKNERPTLPGATSSKTEREVLKLLQQEAGYPPSLRELRGKLLPFLTELQIQKALISLLKEGAVDTVFTSGHELGFKLRPWPR